MEFRVIHKEFWAHLSCIIQVFKIMYIFLDEIGIEIYGRCLKFRIVDTKPELDNGEWYCLNDDSNKYMYCQYHLCASTSAHCKTPESSIGKCKYCYGKIWLQCILVKEWYIILITIFCIKQCQMYMKHLFYVLSYTVTTQHNGLDSFLE